MHTDIKVQLNLTLAMDRCDVAEEAIFIESRHDELKEEENMMQVHSDVNYTTSDHFYTFLEVGVTTNIFHFFLVPTEHADVVSLDKSPEAQNRLQVKVEHIRSPFAVYC